MDHLTDLFRIMELTRLQPQYGYAVRDIATNDLSNLAEHHYLVTFFAWQLASQLKNKGAKIDVLRVVEFAMVHDLGEIFGGDISMPYAQVNPSARKHAKAFEAENQKFLSKFFGSGENHFMELGEEILDAKSDEALIAKVADYLEHPYYLRLVKAFNKKDHLEFNGKTLVKLISKIKDPVAKRELGKFVKKWVHRVCNDSAFDVIFKSKKNARN